MSRRRAPPRHACDDSEKRPGGGAVDRLIESGECERFPEQAAQARRLVMPSEPFADGLIRCRRCRRSRELHQDRTDAKYRDTLAPGQLAPGEDTADEMQRRRQWRETELESRPIFIDHRNV
jgi:hypothetical protein